MPKIFVSVTTHGGPRFAAVAALAGIHNLRVCDAQIVGFLIRKIWYPRLDSNQHTLRRGILNPLRLPFRHSGNAPAL
jgi:hypothetical protein